MITKKILLGAVLSLTAGLASASGPLTGVGLSGSAVAPFELNQTSSIVDPDLSEFTTLDWAFGFDFFNDGKLQVANFVGDTFSGDGYNLTFTLSGLSGVQVSGISLVSTSGVTGMANSAFSFTANSISMNLAGTSWSPVFNAAEGAYDVPVFTAQILTSPIPEPGTCAMLLAGLGCLGYVGLRRKA